MPLRLYLIEIPYDAYDLDSDGFVDYIEWNVPHLSAQTYEIVISTQGYTGDAVKDGNYYHIPISSVAPYDSLVGYWSFDAADPSGVYVYDFTSNNNDGTLQADAVVNTTGCVYDDCLQLDGVGDYVNVGGPSPWNTIDNVSVSFWFKPNTIVGAHYIFNKYESLSEAWGVWANTQYLQIFDDIDNVGAQKASFRFYNPNIWIHAVAILEDNGDGTYENLLYVNGNLEASGKNSTGNWSSFGGSLYFGVRYPPTASDWNGSIDEVMIFNTSLTPAQILAIYNNQSARFVTSGTLNVNQTNITSGYDTVNITNVFENNMDTNISLLLGYYNTSWSYTDAQNITSSNLYTISNQATNLTFNFTFLPDVYAFYTPLLNDSKITAVTSDTILPIITILAPANNSNFNISSVGFNISANEQLSWCGLSISGAANQTMTLNASSTGAGHINASIGDGSYTVVFYANDTLNNIGQSSTRDFYLTTPVCYPHNHFNNTWENAINE